MPSGILLNEGGNVCAAGPKHEGQAWAVTNCDPLANADDYLYVPHADGGSVVTSVAIW